MLWPRFWEAVVGDVITLYAERVLDDLGGAVAVVAVDHLLQNVSHDLPLNVFIRPQRIKWLPIKRAL
jgi:hypothetical protein